MGDLLGWSSDQMGLVGGAGGAGNEVRVDLGGQVGADRPVAPGGRVAQVELDGAAVVGGPVAAPGVEGGAQRVEHRPVGRLQPADRGDRAALGRPHPRRPVEAAEQRVADLRAQPPGVLGVGDLVAEHPQRHPVPGRVRRVLPVHADPAPGRLADQHGQVEPGEQAGRERVGARGHVHHHVLAGPVHQVVEVELHGTGLGVVAGHADVVLVELAGDQVPDPFRGARGEAAQQLAGRDRGRAAGNRGRAAMS